MRKSIFAFPPSTRLGVVRARLDNKDGDHLAKAGKVAALPKRGLRDLVLIRQPKIRRAVASSTAFVELIIRSFPLGCWEIIEFE